MQLARFFCELSLVWSSGLITEKSADCALSFLHPDVLLQCLPADCSIDVIGCWLAVCHAKQCYHDVASLVHCHVSDNAVCGIVCYLTYYIAMCTISVARYCFRHVEN